MELKGSIKKNKMRGILGTNPSSVPITVDNALSLSSTNPVQNRVITAAIKNRLWSDEVKAALLQIVEKVAYVDDHGQDYYDALYDALYPPVGLDSIGAVFDSSATIYNTDTLDDLKQYLTVTAYYTSGDSEVVTTYTLSGSMDAGAQTITVSYGGETTTFTVTVVEWLVSITAVFTQGSATIYDTDSLDTLRQYLVVTATYSDSTTAVVSDYTLSGTLTAGTSTITASYGGKTDTFSVTVTHSDFTAVFTQGEATIWSDDSLDVLKQYLVVTLDGDEVSGYTLSGTLDSASSVITVSYNGHSTTITVSVTLVGTTEYASELSNFKRVSTAGITGYSDGVLWLKCANSTQISSYACWVFDPKKTLWDTVNGKTLRIRFHAKSNDWSGDLSNTNQIVHGVAIFSGPNITSGSGRQKFIGVGNIAPTSSYQNYDYVLQADLNHITSGTGTPTSSSTFGVTIYSQSLHTVQYDAISVREVLN